MPQDFNFPKKKKQQIDEERLRLMQQEENLKAQNALLQYQFNQLQRDNTGNQLSQSRNNEFRFKKEVDLLNRKKLLKQKELDRKRVILENLKNEQNLIIKPNTAAGESGFLTIFSQQKFSHSYSKFLSVGSGYIGLKEEHNSNELKERLDNLTVNFSKVLQIIDAEKNNEQVIRKKIEEIGYSHNEIVKQNQNLIKKLNAINHRCQNAFLIEKIAGKKMNLANINLNLIKSEFEKKNLNDINTITYIKNVKDQEENVLKEDRMEISRLRMDIEEKFKFKNQLSLQIELLDKEILEKQLKKVNSKYTIQYIEVFLQLYELFIKEPMNKQLISRLYEEFETEKLLEKESIRLDEKKQKRNSLLQIKSDDIEFVDRSILLEKIDIFYSKFRDGPIILAHLLCSKFSLISVETQSYERMYDETLLIKQSKKTELENLDDILLETLTIKNHILPNSFAENYGYLNLDMKEAAKNVKSGEAGYTPRDGETINLLLNQVDAFKFHWRKKDLALIQNFTFKCYLSLTESLFRASLILEIFMAKMIDLEYDHELSAFFDIFTSKMTEYRKGFLLKRRPSIIDQSLDSAFLSIPKIASINKQKFSILNQTAEIQSSTKKGDNLKDKENQTAKNIELLNEIELYSPLSLTELLEIFFSIFPEKEEMRHVAEEWAIAVQKDKTTSHFQSKEGLQKYLEKIKKDKNGNSKEKAKRTLENMILLKEEALQIEMIKIREMMELYGQFSKLFMKKLSERRLGISIGSPKKLPLLKDFQNDFVKKSFIDKYFALSNKNKDIENINEKKNDLVNKKEDPKNVHFEEKDEKEKQKEKKEEKEKIQFLILDLSKKTQEKKFEHSPKIKKTTLLKKSQSLIKEDTPLETPKEPERKKTIIEEIDEEEVFFEIERKNIKDEEERKLLLRTQPPPKKKHNALEAFEKYKTSPDIQMTQIIDNQKLIHKLKNLEHKLSPLEQKPIKIRNIGSESELLKKKFSSTFTNNITLFDTKKSEKEKTEKFNKKIQKTVDFKPQKYKLNDRKTVSSFSNRKQFSFNKQKPSTTDLNNQKITKKSAAFPYLNTYSSVHDFLQWDLSSGINVFTSPTAYNTLPFLLNFRGNSEQSSRNILIEQTNSYFN